MDKLTKTTIKTNYVWGTAVILSLPLLLTGLFAILDLSGVTDMGLLWITAPIWIVIAVTLLVAIIIAVYVKSVRKGAEKEVCLNCIHSLYQPEKDNFYCLRNGMEIKKANKHTCESFYGSLMKGFKAKEE